VDRVDLGRAVGDGVRRDGRAVLGDGYVEVLDLRYKVGGNLRAALSLRTAKQWHQCVTLLSECVSALLERLTTQAERLTAPADETLDEGGRAVDEVGARELTRGGRVDGVDGRLDDLLLRLEARLDGVGDLSVEGLDARHEAPAGGDERLVGLALLGRDAAPAQDLQAPVDVLEAARGRSAQVLEPGDLRVDAAELRLGLLLWREATNDEPGLGDAVGELLEARRDAGGEALQGGRALVEEPSVTGDLLDRATERRDELRGPRAQSSDRLARPRQLAQDSGETRVEDARGLVAGAVGARPFGARVADGLADRLGPGLEACRCEVDAVRREALERRRDDRDVRVRGGKALQHLVLGVDLAPAVDLGEDDLAVRADELARAFEALREDLGGVVVRADVEDDLRVRVLEALLEHVDRP